MPNGGYEGTLEDWEKIEAPLVEIDPLLAQFAAERKLEVVKNYHNWPQRYLNWVSRDINRSIQIVAADVGELRFHIGITAWVDKNGHRYGIDALLRRYEPWQQIRDDLDKLLEEGFTMSESWSEKDLKPG